MTTQKTPIRYAGGKSRALKHVLSLIPKNRRIVSPFFGGGSVEIAVASRGQEVVGYDIFDVLVNYWQNQINNPKGLADILRKWKPTPEEYRRVKERLKKAWKAESIEPPLALAALYWFNHNLSYGPGFLGWMSKIYADDAVYNRMVSRVCEFAPGRISVSLGSFGETIPTHSDDFLFCDPPYYLGGNSTLFRGIYPQRNFPIHHNGFDHAKLAGLLRGHRGGFLLCYNDCPEVRALYPGYEIKEVSWHYSMGQGETRIGKNRKDGKHTKKSSEVLIYAAKG